MKKIEWESTILGNEELFKNLDLWRKYQELHMDEDDNPLERGFLLSINGGKLYFETDEELVVLLKSYKNAVKTNFEEIERDCIEISTVYGYHTIAEYEIDQDNVYKYDWFISYYWEKEIKYIKKILGRIKND